ncbi:MAG: hypothetical protein E5Y61_01705 [Mesorhizobium sp.]|nr:MAG: hypothetical protein E5Y61_01705 [Mesorhizobium sp.]TIM79915.1 MAG: hypothetical protein E5Y60_06595 [Mesorhizobium sp.]
MDEATRFIDECRFFHDGLRSYYMDLVQKFTALELHNANFQADLTSGSEDKFWQRIWEAILGCHLADLGYKPSAPKDGPDFLIHPNGKPVWVEAICPTPKNIPAEYVAHVSDNEVRVTSVPFDELTLNWTAALKEKMEKLEGKTDPVGKPVPGYVAKNVVPADQPYVIAVNSNRWGSAEFGVSQFPFSAEVGLGIGPIAVKVDTETGKFGAPEHTARFQILNKNKSTVGTSVFTSDEYKGVSAVLSTGALCPQPKDFPYVVVHNPLARAPIPQGLFGTAAEYLSRLDGEYIEVTRVH